VLVDQRRKRDDKGEWCGYTYNVRVISWVIYYEHHQIVEYIMNKTQQHNEENELSSVAENTPHPLKSEISTCNEHEIDISRLVEECRLLLLSCYSGDVQTVRVLLPIFKGTINRERQICRDIGWYEYLYSPLTVACWRGHVSVVEELVKAGADVNL
jgi:hypothetical protein